MLQAPGLGKGLRDDPSLIETAVEEFLRYDAPVQMGMRGLTAPINLSGGTLPEGAMIWTLQAAAPRDERATPDPDTLDVRRRPNRHMALAAVIHTCLGMPLARAEARVALRRLICDYPDLRPNGPADRALRTRYRGFAHYPIASDGAAGRSPATDPITGQRRLAQSNHQREEETPGKRSNRGHVLRSMAAGAGLMVAGTPLRLRVAARSWQRSSSAW